MKFLTESRCPAETAGGPEIKKTNYFHKVMNKTDITADITRSNHVSATRLHIQNAVHTLDTETTERGNQMELPK